MLAFWRVWLYPLDPLTRVIASLVVNELHDLPINCLPSELVSFTPPSGMTCTQWAGDFVAQAGGYLVDGAATTSCDYCKFSLGQQFYEPLGLSYSSRYSDWGILVAFVISNSAITVAATRWLVSLESFDHFIPVADSDSRFLCSRTTRNDRAIPSSLEATSCSHIVAVNIVRP